MYVLNIFKLHNRERYETKMLKWCLTAGKHIISADKHEYDEMNMIDALEKIADNELEPAFVRRYHPATDTICISNFVVAPPL